MDYHGRVSLNVSCDITRLLVAWRDGDDDALTRLLPLTYRRLKQIAAHVLRGESGQQLQTTALVHEAYLRLVNLEAISWQNRAHFYAMSSRIMRRVLVDEARRRATDKRSGEEVKISVDDLRAIPGTAPPDILGLHEALKDLAAIDPERARIVELRYFGGLNREQIGEVLGMSRNTVARRWRSARAWLLSYLTEAPA